jgi:hypothetical protein
VQLVFSKLNGMKCLRVATASIKLTEDRTLAEKGANITVIGTHAAQRAAKYAKDGDYERAQMETRAARRFMNRNNDGAKEVYLRGKKKRTKKKRKPRNWGGNEKQKIRLSYYLFCFNF